MKLIRQCKLYFKEGSSDKVYEIDLCGISSNEYIVNFRYGRRGGTLKEGTKTPEAVNLPEAERLFSVLENEKRKKGYQTEVEVFIELPDVGQINPETAEGVILQRLSDAVNGTSVFKTQWKTSRVIWKAGEIGLKEAIPFIIKLAAKGDEMQLYSSLYALTKLEAQQAEPLFQAYAFQPKQKHYIRHIACEGLLTILDGEELTKVIDGLIRTLPYDLRNYIGKQRYRDLLLSLYNDTGIHHVDFFTTLYLIAKIKKDLLPVLGEVIGTYDTDIFGYKRKDALYRKLKNIRSHAKAQSGLVDFDASGFRQIRSIYKLSQLRSDYQTMASFAYSFEKNEANFQKPFTRRTKKYLQRNSFITLNKLGKSGDPVEYLKYAVSILLQYKEDDYKPAGEMPQSWYGRYDYSKRLYYFTLINRPECYDSLLLSCILFGNDPARRLDSNMYFYVSERIVSSREYYFNPNKVYLADNQPSLSGSKSRPSIFDSVKSLFGKRKSSDAATSVPGDTPPPPPTEEEIKEMAGLLSRTELYPDLWDSMPSAYIQLLIQAKMNIIHQFAYNNLLKHPDYTHIITRFDKNSLVLLLNSNFEIPNKLGFEIIEKRKNEFISDGLFLAQVLNSNSSEARVFAQYHINNNLTKFLEDINFITCLICNNKKENNNWIESVFKQAYLSNDRKQALLGKLISELLHLEYTDENEDMSMIIVDRINLFFPQELYKISWDVVEELILSPLPTNLWLASCIINEKSQRVYPTEIPLSTVDLFLRTDIDNVVENGIRILNKFPSNYLVDNINFILNQTDTFKENVLKAVLDVLKKLVKSYPVGNITTKHLVYALIRKEKFEGAHAIINHFVKTELKPYWNSGLTPKDITKLIHSPFRESQLTGYEILTAYPRPNDFTIPQIISFGNHELIAVRSWCISYYTNNLSRIRFEKDQSLSLLDAKWEDTRLQAFRFFRNYFTDTDWDVDTLISIVDSIRPDVQEFGKELIMKYVKPDHMIMFLRKLSEHPSVTIQSFISVYLNEYASDDTGIIKKLEYYFRSVLTRVNKARVAKNRIYIFLHQEGLKNEETAAVIVPILDDLSAQSTVQDKEKCIRLLTEIKNKYPHLDMHLKLV